MSVKCQTIINELDKIAPHHLAETWDNVGLLVGSPEQSIKKIFLTLDVNEDVVEQALSNKVDMIITHHPLIFNGVKCIRTDLPQGRLLAKIIKNDIALYASHTNLDIACGGVNDILAGKFDLIDVEPLTESYVEKLIKLVVFVPVAHVEAVRQAICEAGAGHIGNYSCCTFQTDGMGTFLPQAGTNPFIGGAGKLERVQEVRLETVMPEKISKRVLEAMLKAHPYEEVAYDLFLLANKHSKLGIGRIGCLVVPKSLKEFALEVKKILGVNFLRVVGSQGKSINKVAVCGGSGAGLIQAAASAGADVLVTGDVKYHEAQDAIAANVAIIDAGHFATERVVIDYLYQILYTSAIKDGWNIEIVIDNTSKDVFCGY